MTVARGRLSVAVVTGSRAEFGLLEPVMRAVREHPALELVVVVAGSHLVGPSFTWRDVAAAGFEIAARVEMQREGVTGRFADAEAAGRGVFAFAGAFAEVRPAWVVVLGDRIEAFAAAAAASIAGIAVAHLHGGDRAEGIADEALRHAITKLAHLHLPATEGSARRVERMGENPRFIRVIGSPAIDGLDAFDSMSGEEAAGLGDPAALFLMHASGLDAGAERALVRSALAGAQRALRGRAMLCVEPNLDAGREVVLAEVRSTAETCGWRVIDHLPRGRFVALLKRLASRGGVLIGNSSAGLIEAAALRLPAVNIGPRQAGRARPDNVIDAETGDAVERAVERALSMERGHLSHPYGVGGAGIRAAEVLACTEPDVPALLRKRCAY